MKKQVERRFEQRAVTVRAQADRVVIRSNEDCERAAETLKKVKAWQQECANHPAIYNQGNVLRDRLAKLTADIETPITEVDVSGWGVWAGQAIQVPVARHIAGKINTLIAASKAGAL